MTTLLALSVGTDAASAIGLSANFESEGTDTADQFVGAPGGGWLGAWQPDIGSAATGNGVRTHGQVFSTDNPISGLGSVQITHSTTRTNSAGSTQNVGYLTREWEGVGAGVNPGNPYTVSFDFRIDDFSNTGNAFSSWADFQFGSVSPLGNVRFGFQATANGRLRLFDGTATGQDTNNAISAGVVYNFSATVTPSEGLWSFVISRADNPSNIAASATDRPVASTTNEAGWIRFGAAAGGVNDPNAPPGFISTMAWTVDNISIVPEPGAYALAFGIAILLFAVWRRRDQLC